MEHWQNSGTLQNISRTPQNTNGTTTKHQRNTQEQQNHTKQRNIVEFFKENLNLALIHLTMEL